MLLTRTLQKQGQAHRQHFERELESRAEKIQALEVELSATKKKLEEEDAARKSSDEQVAKMQTDFDQYRCDKQDERRKVAAEAQKACDAYRVLLMGVGEEAEAPRDVPIATCLSWLADELGVLGNHMAIGWEYASLETLRACAQALMEGGCDHFAKVEVKEPKSYWMPPAEANDTATRFFDAFWRPGGCDLALLRAALSRGQVWLCSFSFGISVLIETSPHFDWSIRFRRLLRNRKLSKRR